MKRSTSGSVNETAIVIGAGIVGISCAHYLSKAGLQVTLLDRRTVGSACSYANCGYICPSHVLPLTEPSAIRVALKSLLNPKAPFRVKPRFSPALWNWMWQFARRCTHHQMLESGKHLKSILDASMTAYRSLMEEEGLSCQWKDTGLLYVLQTKKGFKEFANTDKILCDNFGVEARPIDGDQLQEFEPALKPGLAGAFHYPDDAFLRPDLLSSQWSERLRIVGSSPISFEDQPHYDYQRRDASRSIHICDRCLDYSFVQETKLQHSH
jgi:D-amino-acid dehydrogenase